MVQSLEGQLLDKRASIDSEESADWTDGVTLSHGAVRGAEVLPLHSLTDS